MSTYQTTGFTLSNRDFREADKFFSIYTDTHGKIEVLAAGVRKIQSKLRAHLEPFSIVNLMIARGRHYDRLIGAVQQKNYEKIKSNYNLLIINYQLLEIIDQLAKPNHPDPRIFNLLKEVFDCLENQDGDESLISPKPPDNNETREQFSQSNYQLLSVRSYFITNFLSLLGYAPELMICIRCKAPISLGFKTEVNPKIRVYFSYHDGGVICKKCLNDNDRQISPESVNILKRYLSQSLENCWDIGTDESSKLTNDFLNYHLDRPLASVKIGGLQI